MTFLEQWGPVTSAFESGTFAGSYNPAEMPAFAGSGRYSNAGYGPASSPTLITEYAPNLGGEPLGTSTPRAASPAIGGSPAAVGVINETNSQTLAGRIMGAVAPSQSTWAAWFARISVGVLGVVFVGGGLVMLKSNVINMVKP